MNHLPIPKFLVRNQVNAVFGKRQKLHMAMGPRWVQPKLPFSKKPPASQKFRGAEKTTIHLEDECKSIGSGVRTVWAKVGRTWVHLCDPLGNRGKLRVDVFKRLVREN